MTTCEKCGATKDVFRFKEGTFCIGCFAEKTAGRKPRGEAIIVSNVSTPQPEPKPRELEPRTLADLMRQKGWGEK